MNGMESKILNSNVWDSDPELFKLIVKEKNRQKHGIELIASENFTSLSVLQCLSSSLHNKLSEGLPFNRFYGGCEYIDKIEVLCQQRALQAYKLTPEKWGGNVQLYSGSPANFAVYTAVVGSHGRIMGLDLPDGGHLTHGFFTPSKKISASAMFFESMPYKVDPSTGLIDYDTLEKTAQLFKPQLIVAGISCYSRILDYQRFRQIADNVGALLMGDMAHISGLVAAGVIPSPFEYCDIVTTTTHKSLRGPRGGAIFYRKGTREVNGKTIEYDLDSKINQAIFPALQGGPHNHRIGAMATAFKQAQSQEFKDYQQQVVKNAKRMAAGLMEKGYHIATGGTDIHMLLVNLKPSGFSGAKAETILEAIHIACNKNTVPGDKSAFNPSGIRFGTPAITTRGLVEKDVDKVVEFIDRGLKLGKEVESISGPKLADFKKVLSENTEIQKKVMSLRNEVNDFSSKFILPGLEDY